MPKTSSHSVRHDAVPEERVLAAAREWARRLREDHPEVVRVGYFGSYARGDYVPGSDFDVLTDVSALAAGAATGGARLADRAVRYRPESFPVGLEIIVYTLAELASLRAAGASFIRAIDAELCDLSPDT